MITKEAKSKAMADAATHKTDVGSPQVQAAVLTARIKEITEHLQANKHDHMARRGLIQMVGKRKKLLKYLENKDFAAYQAIVAKLGLRK
jgi:small subunit ribosomal protein S15